MPVSSTVRTGRADSSLECAAGCEWVVEAHGCLPGALRDLAQLKSFFALIVSEVGLHPVGEGTWHQFPGTGGITGLQLLAESHLACHTFPEYGSLCLNLFCCRPRPDWDFATALQRDFGAGNVEVRKIQRPYGDQ